MRICSRCSKVLPDDAVHCPVDGGLTETPDDPLLGRTVGGRFRLISRLGEGGMSSVYLARHVLIDRLVAIKILRSSLAEKHEHRERFMREARAVNRIHHENIVVITDFGESDDGLVYLVMEYVPGEVLSEVMNEGALPMKRSLVIARQLASGLGRAHQMNVVHRDLKPDNVMLVPRRDRDDFVKILDFGIAKLLDAPSLTASHQLFGTPAYMAPEYLRGEEVDGRTDLYSLGVILYEMMTGELPFEYERPFELLAKHVTEPPIDPRQRLPSMDDGLAEFLLRALDKVPEARFRDAFHCIAELDAIGQRLGASLVPGSAEPVIVASMAPLPLPGEDTVSQVPDTLVEQVSQRVLDLAAEAELESAPTSQAALPPEIPGAPTREFPLPGAVAGDLPSEPTSPGLFDPKADGIAGVRRWRQRYRAIRMWLDGIEAEQPAPRPVARAMAGALHALEELEQRAAAAQEMQVEVEGLDAKASDFRAKLGAEADGLAAQLSSSRGELQELLERRVRQRAQRDRHHEKTRAATATDDASEGLLWELASVEEAIRSQGVRAAELEFQVAELAQQLEWRNERVEATLRRLVGVLEQELGHIDGLTASLRADLDCAEAFVLQAQSAPREGSPTA